jgi:hypothetical protein
MFMRRRPKLARELALDDCSYQSTQSVGRLLHGSTAVILLARGVAVSPRAQAAPQNMGQYLHTRAARALCCTTVSRADCVRQASVSQLARQ